MTGYANVQIYFMSGTGNSFRVAREIAEAAARSGAEVEMTPMGRDFRPSRIEGGSSTLVLVATPTHGFTAPWLAIWFALRMPRGRGAHCAVIATRGSSKFGRVILPGLDGTAAYIPALVMALKGYSVRGAIGIDMPSNWLAVHPGVKPETADAIIARSAPTRRRFYGRILAGKRFYGSWVAFPLGIALAPVSFGYLLFGRAMFGKLFFATDKCDGCGVCAKYCQHNAIRMLGSPPRPYWTYRCESCFRCMSFCPKATIEVSHSMAVILGFGLSVYPPVLAGFFLGPDGVWGATGFARHALPVLNYAFWLGFLMLAYSVFWAALRLRPAGAFFKWTTFTRIWRRYRESSVKLPDLVKRRNWKSGQGVK